jgi:hypothetical protein
LALAVGSRGLVFQIQDFIERAVALALNGGGGPFFIPLRLLFVVVFFADMRVSFPTGVFL